MEPIEYIMFCIKVIVKDLIGKAIDRLLNLFLSMALDMDPDTDTDTDMDTETEEDVDTAEEVGSVSVNP